MYGLVNKAVEKFVIENHGEKVWLEIKNHAGIKEESFISMQPYPDKMTYDLVGAASELLNVEAEKILELFGEYWIKFSMIQGYGELLNLAGKTFPEFLKNLDNMHSNIAQSYTKLQPPSFICNEIDEQTFELVYISHRAGLMPFVKGLLIGLGNHFNIKLEISYKGSLEENKHLFKINYFS